MNSPFRFLYALFLTVSILFKIGSYAQSSDIKIDLCSGLFYFRGSGTNSRTTLLGPGSGFGENLQYPFSNKPGFVIAPEIIAQKLTKNNGLYGLAVSFQKTSNKIPIDSVFIKDENDQYYYYPAKGKADLEFVFTNVFPFVGKRFGNDKVMADVTAGLNFGFHIKSSESGSFQSNVAGYDFYYLKAAPSVDLQPRAQVNVQLNRFGFVAGYSFGLTNFRKGYSDKAYSSFLRLGISYTISQGSITHYTKSHT